MKKRWSDIKKKTSSEQELLEQYESMVTTLNQAYTRLDRAAPDYRDAAIYAVCEAEERLNNYIREVKRQQKKDVQLDGRCLPWFVVE